MVFSYKLYNILDDLNKHKRNRSESFQEAVQERLDNALQMYVKSLENSKSYLLCRDSLSVMNKFNKG